MPGSSPPHPIPWLLAGVLAAVAVPAQAPALALALVQGQDDAKANAVRVAVLYKITSYITVDVATHKPGPTYRIGLLGDDDTAALARKVLPGKKVGDAAIELVTVSAEDAASGKAATTCDILYIASPIADELLAKVLAAYAALPLPLVCTRPRFCADGGTVQLFVQDGNVKFEVNTEALKKQKLAASAQFLKRSTRGPR